MSFELVISFYVVTTLFIDFTTSTLCKVETVKRLVYETIRTRTYIQNLYEILFRTNINWIESLEIHCVQLLFRTHTSTEYM